MSGIDTIKFFLNSTAGISQAQFQIWTMDGELLVSTEVIDPATAAFKHGRTFAKGVGKRNKFIYRVVDGPRFLAGVPMAPDHAAGGILVAHGAMDDVREPDSHKQRINAFLEQTACLLAAKLPSVVPPETVPDQLENPFDDLYLFANLSSQFESLRLKKPMLGQLLRRTVVNMQADAAFLHLPQHPQFTKIVLNPDYRKFGLTPENLLEPLRDMIPKGLRCISGDDCMINDSKQHPAFASLAERTYRFMATRLRHGKSQYGWLGMVSFEPGGTFTPKMLHILETLANQLAFMIANMDHYDAMEQFTVNMLCSLVYAIEAKDAYTRGHSQRVHQYATHMGRHLELPEHEQKALQWAAILHDIGKIGIPEKILRKPGRLTQQEFALIKRHPDKAVAIIEPIGQLAPSIEAIAHHHERLNGKGYPKGLKGKQIPLAARIIAVADTFDAITSKRSYHAVKSPQEAMLVLDQVAGTQLDPHLVNVFKMVFQKLQRSAEKKKVAA